MANDSALRHVSVDLEVTPDRWYSAPAHEMAAALAAIITEHIITTVTCNRRSLRVNVALPREDVIVPAGLEDLRLKIKATAERAMTTVARAVASAG